MKASKSSKKAKRVSKATKKTAKKSTKKAVSVKTKVTNKMFTVSQGNASASVDVMIIGDVFVYDDAVFANFKEEIGQELEHKLNMSVLDHLGMSAVEEIGQV